MTSPYFEIDGYDFTSIITFRGAVSPKGGSLKIDEYPYPGRNYATPKNMGKQLLKFNVEAASNIRSDIETFMDVVNNAPEDSEVYPFDSDRFAYVYAASATALQPKRILSSGSPAFRYMAEAEITVKGAWLYGPDKGTGLLNDPTLWISTAYLTNDGNLPAGLDYLLISGGYDGNYNQNFGVRLWYDSYTETAGHIDLCTKLLRNDRFEVNRWGEVAHSYETDFPMTYAEHQIDVHGATYFNYGSGGSIAHEALHLGTTAWYIIPFYGPLPISESPVIECFVTSITGSPGVGVGWLSDISDWQCTFNTFKLGYNRIEIPDCIGMQNAFIGFANTTDQITLKWIKITVKRYIAPSEMYLVEPGESFYITAICDTGYLAEQLIISYSDLYWW